MPISAEHTESFDCTTKTTATLDTLGNNLPRSILHVVAFDFIEQIPAGNIYVNNAFSVIFVNVSLG